MRYVIWLILCLLSLQGFAQKEILYGKAVNDFKLRNVNGKMVSLASYPAAKGFIVVFTCNHCPFAKRYPERLNALDKKYKGVGVPLIAISSVDTTVYDEDAYPEMVKKAKEGKYSFPYLYDPLQIVGRNFGAAKTPHAFVIWKERGNWIVKYDGGIDDNGAEPAKVKSKFVENAVDALLAGKEVAVKDTKSVGCVIHYRK